MSPVCLTATVYRRAWPALLLALAACVTPGPVAPPAGDRLSQQCNAFFIALDDAIDAARVRDAEAARIPGFPYLRVDRFLASFRSEVTDGRVFHAWVGRLLDLDRAARDVEIANLPDAARAALPRPTGDSIAASVVQCGARLRDAALADPANRALLRRRADVPDEYRTSWRVFGLYPLAALFVAHGVGKWQRETQATFRRPLTELAVAGVLKRYVPPTAISDVDIAAVARTARDPLGVPLPTEAELERLYARHAPVFEIDQAGTADVIGTPALGDDDRPRVDTGNPTVYRRLSFARAAGDVLLQLNYIIWFPERPRTGAFDIQGGRLDGITWRVTLGPDGRPLLYDSMHNCGCYHMFFPVPPMRLRAGFDRRLEPPLVPQPGPALAAGMRTVVRVAHGTHYLERVYTAGDPRGAHYRFEPLGTLRSLPYADGRRSLYRPDGIVAGTDRAERWLIWPMGVPAPGAMRQWGHHATAFIGRRHFDDPNLVAELFEGYSP